MIPNERYDFENGVAHDDIIQFNEGADRNVHVITFLKDELWLAHEHCPESSGTPLTDDELKYLRQLIDDYLLWKTLGKPREVY